EEQKISIYNDEAVATENYYQLDDEVLDLKVDLCKEQFNHVSLEDDDEWDNVGFSLCTLTLIPMCRDQVNRYEVVLSDGRINQEVCAVSGVMETSFYRSVLIGAWFCGDDSRGFKLCQSYNNLEWLEPYGWGLLGGLSFSSRGRECMKDVFIETFAFDLAKAVIDWENQKKEVKEFRNNKKGN
ncbi:MAG: hypothetical protein IKZ36_02155, partial [Kiritimatiellae bacterium]|nr:hypothetical protein [Kiritimatiellia bacterium]